MPVYTAKPPLPSIDKLWRIVNGTISVTVTCAMHRLKRCTAFSNL